MPVNAAYVAGFSGTPTSGSAPLTVQFTDLSSGAPSSWYWDFGDRATAETQNPSHIYTAPGTYSIRLTVTGGGFSDSNLQIGYITVDVPTPTPTVTTPTQTETTTSSIKAGFSGSPTTGTAPLTVKFTESSTGSPTSWYWDFGDGSQSRQEKPPEHTLLCSWYLYGLINRNRRWWHQCQDTHRLCYCEGSDNHRYDPDNCTGTNFCPRFPDITTANTCGDSCSTK